MSTVPLEFFEEVATKTIADNLTSKLTTDLAHAMPDAFRERLISLFVGGRDRGRNGLRSLIHGVAQYLIQYTETHTNEQWLQVLQDCLNRCKLCNDSNEIFKGYQAGTRFSGHYNEDELRAASFMFAVIAEDDALQSKMLLDDFEPREDVHYFGNPLHMACRLGLQSTTRKLLEAGAGGDYMETKALLIAVENNQPEIVKLLLESNEYESGGGDRFLRDLSEFAADNNNREILEILAPNLEHAANAAIRTAAFNGWDDMLEYLIGSDLYMTDDYWSDNAGGTPMVYAAQGGHLSTCQLVLENSEKVDLEHEDLLRATAFGGNVEVLKLVLREKLDFHYPDHLPVIAAVKGHLEMLRFVLNKGYQLKRKKSKGLMRYALIAAIYNHHHDVVEYLISRQRIDLNIELTRKGEDVVLPLIAAVDSGNSDMVRLIIRLGASMDKIPWNFTSFSREGRKYRHSLVEDFKIRSLKLTHMYSRWEYKVYQREVEEALQIFLE
jgi:ankyrin repeat protein